ncbi:L,D-transpeptidase family protein [Rubrivirga sp.]|uniref:L,D-transpeptidase family protein n=1 Tax=Rubrivirga sp. TaxID=1885344 RepID=UPI003B51EF7E
MARQIALVLLVVAAASAHATPPDPPARLSAALDRYRAIAHAGGWASVPDGPLVHAGQADAAQVPALRQRLRAEGALGDAAPAGDTLDPALAAALARTQARLGLDADGILGPKTRAALNVPAAERARQVATALDRVANLDLPRDGRWVLVNVPEYRVRGFDAGRETITMKAVVGADADGWRTPLFRDEIEYVVFRPFWNVPTSIAVAELAPQGPEALAADGFELVRSFSPDAEVHPMTAENLQRLVDGHLLIRQAAGPANALGLLKVMFPNAHNVYLHDTPVKGHFARDERALSHGCVRLERPATMGAWLLGWPEAEVQAAMDGGGYQQVDLAARVPVVIAYLPAWAGDDGAVWFAGDPYGLLG